MRKDLAQSLLEHDIKFEVKFNPQMHDREIRIDNGWPIKIGRGLDIYRAETFIGLPESRCAITSGPIKILTPTPILSSQLFVSESNSTLPLV